MAGDWDPRVYRERAEHWRFEAANAAPGETQDAYFALAEGYTNLADLIERDIGPGWDRFRSGDSELDC
jgi:hypothetical protein